MLTSVAMPQEPRPDTRLELLQGTLDTMVLQTSSTLGPQHGYGIARRIEQVERQRRPPEPGHDLRVARAPAGSRLDFGALGRLGTQPPREVLCDHPARADPAE